MSFKLNAETSTACLILRLYQLVAHSGLLREITVAHLAAAHSAGMLALGAQFAICLARCCSPSS